MFPKGTKILLVDDNLDILEGLKLWFEYDGFTVFTAEGPRRGFESFKMDGPDIVVTDIVFPSFSTDKPNGFQLCDWIREREKETGTRCILGVMTGKEDNFSEPRAKIQDADFFIKKPFSGQELFDKIESIAEARKKRNPECAKSVGAPSTPKLLAIAFALIFGALLLFMAIGFGGIVAIAYHFHAVEQEGHAREMKERRDSEKEMLAQFMEAMRREQALEMAGLQGQVNYLEPRVLTLEKELSRMHGEMGRKK